MRRDRPAEIGFVVSAPSSVPNAPVPNAPGQNPAAQSSASQNPAARPLAFTADETLLDDLVRLGAAAGVTFDVAHDLGSARRVWSRASLVVVGTDRADALARATPPRRREVYVVGYDADDASAWQSAVQLGADGVLALPAAEPRLIDRLADAAEGVNREATTIGVIGGRGGAGASTLAVGLATTAVATGLSTVLVDADPFGGGIDLLLGAEDASGVRWPELVSTRGRVSTATLREALPRVGELSVLSWDRGDPVEVPAEAMRAVLGAAQRGNDFVVIDLPRQLDSGAGEAVARCTTILVVVPAQVRAVAAAGRVRAMLAALASDIRVVVRGPAPARLDARLIAEVLRLPLAGELAPERGLDRRLDEGVPPGRRAKGPLATFSRRFLPALTARAAA